MRRYWVEEKFFEGEEYVWLEAEQYQHIVRVCRQNIGSRFEVLQGAQAFLVEICELQKAKAKAKILEIRDIEELPSPRIHLVLSLPRFQKTDEIIEKSVELGVYKVRPFLSDFSYVRSLDKVGKNKLQRWDRIVKAATQQCGRGGLMEVAPVTGSLELIFKEFNQGCQKKGLFFYEGEGQKTLPEALKGINASDFEEIWLFVGSEGGFSYKEVESFQKLGLGPITLGSQILRVETACTSLVSIIKYELLM